MESKKKATPFQKAHALEFVFEIVSTDARGHVTVRCLFCLYEGGDIAEVGVAEAQTSQRYTIFHKAILTVQIPQSP